MAQASELKAQARDRVGKGAARALRRQGLVPAVIYGEKQPPVGVAVSYKDAMQRIYAGGFLSHVLTLDVDGAKHRVIPRDYQLDPVRDFAVHIDFLRVGADTKLHVEVAVHFTNELLSPGLKRGGVLNIVRHTVELICNPEAIPEAVTIDLEGKDIGDSMHISSVTLPAGVVSAIRDRDFTIATIVAPSGLKSEDAATTTAEPAEGEAAAEGAEATEAKEPAKK